MKALLVHHQDAGHGSHDRDSLLAALAAAGVEATTCEVEPRAVREALEGARSDLIIAAGGDGTVALVITTAADLLAVSIAVPPVAILPLGGLNNIASSLGVWGSAEDVMATLPGGRRVPIDVGQARGAWGRSCFVEAAGFGALNTALSSVAGSPETPSEKLSAGRSAFHAALIEATPSEVALRLDGTALKRPLLTLEVLNVPCIGPRLALAPDADAADGLLDVVMVGPEDRDAMLRWIESDCEARCPVAAVRARTVCVEQGFDRCRLDDPKREHMLCGSAVNIAIMPRQPSMLLPGGRSDGQVA